MEEIEQNRMDPDKRRVQQAIKAVGVGVGSFLNEGNNDTDHEPYLITKDEETPNYKRTIKKFKNDYLHHHTYEQPLVHQSNVWR